MATINFFLDPTSTSSASISGIKGKVPDQPLGKFNSFQINGLTAAGEPIVQYFTGEFDNTSDESVNNSKITAFSVWINNSPAWSFEGVSITISQYRQLFSSLPAVRQAAIDALFAGNDDFTGSPGENGVYTYGGNDTLRGGDGIDTLDGGVGADVMIGGAGNDTYVVDNPADILSEDGLFTDIDTVISSISFTLGSNLENLTLTGNATLDGSGNELANIIIGNVGANRIDGSAGADQMTGGAGNDTYVVDNTADIVSEDSFSSGIDTVESSISFTLGSNLENLTLTGGAALDGSGNELANIIIGNVGANRLDGRAGADQMSGGAGNDTYVVDNTADNVSEDSFSFDIDTVESSVSYTLGSNLEYLTLTGSGDLDGSGNNLANIITGNIGANSLTGGDGVDALVGGAGNDTLNGGDGPDNLVGGEGNDTLIIDDFNDTVSGGEGDDIYILTNNILTIRSLNGSPFAPGNDTMLIDENNTSNFFFLSDDFDIENLTLTGARNFNGTGNRQDNVLTGNNGNNSLVGQAGRDTLIGGLGADILWGNDSLISGSDIDTFVTRQGSSPAATGLGMDTISSGVSNGDQIFFDNGVDYAGDFDAVTPTQDLIDYQGASSPVDFASILNAEGLTSLAAGTAYKIRGTWDSPVFSVGNSGRDYLFFVTSSSGGAWVSGATGLIGTQSLILDNVV